MMSPCSDDPTEASKKELDASQAYEINVNVTRSGAAISLVHGVVNMLHAGIDVELCNN
jgi:hypothetical protein